MRVLLALLLAVPATAAPLPVSLVDIGVAAAVRGAVSAVAPGQEKPVGRVVASGKPLYLNDKVTTGKGGRLQIMLLDETTFTIGSDSEMMLDEFVYDPVTSKGKVSAKIIKGAFRFVTGKIARREVGDMKVGLPTATIGIRGTIVEGQVYDNGDADVSLGGPGQDNNADENPGGITVSNGQGSVDIDNSGYMTSVRGAGRPSDPIRVTAEFKKQTNIVGEESEPGSSSTSGDAGQQQASAGQGGGSPSSGGSGSGSSAPAGPSAGEASGNSVAEGGQHAGMIFENVASGQPEQTNFAAQEATSGAATGLADGLGRWQDVQLLTGGGGQAGYSISGTYSCSGGGCGAGDSGAFLSELFVDFTNKTIGGGGSHVSLNSGPSSGQNTSINAVSYAGNTSGPSTLDLISGVQNGVFRTLSVDLLNKDGVAAKEAKVSFTYDDGEGITGSGSAKGALGELSPR